MYFAKSSLTRVIFIAGALLPACSGRSPGGTDATGGAGTGGNVCGDLSAEAPALPGTLAGETSTRPPCEFCDPEPIVTGDASTFPERPTLAASAGGRAYIALPHGVLSVLDTSAPERPRLLGQQRFHGRPAHLELDGTRVIVVVADDSPEPDAGRQSRVLVFEAEEPSALRVVAELPLAGSPRDVMRTGTFLLVATRASESTYVESIDVADPVAPRVVDSLAIPDLSTSSEVWLPTITFNAGHVYVATPVPGDNGVLTTLDHFVPDASGILERSGQAEIGGAVDGRQRIDATESALTVVTVEADQSFVQVLDPVDLELVARHELPGLTAFVRGAIVYSLESVSQDVSRLAVIDPSSPEALTTRTTEIPGLPYNTSLWPLGDRLIVSHDLETSTETPALSQYDLGSLELTARVEWPGNLGDPSLHVFESTALAAVVYEEPDTNLGLCDPWGSGVRFIDLSNDTLMLGGAIAKPELIEGLYDGPPLLLAAGGMLSVIDAADPGEPHIAAEVRVSSAVDLSAVVGSRVVRVGAEPDDTTNTPYLDVVDGPQAETPADSRVAVGTVEACSWGVKQVFATDDRVVALRDEEALGGDTERSRRVLVSFDASGAGAPTELGATDFPVAARNEPNDSAIVGWTGRAIVSTTTRNAPIPEPTLVDIVDVSDRAGVRHASLELPKGAVASTGLDGSMVFATRVTGPAAGRVQYYLDRVDVSEPLDPSPLPSVPLPGGAIAYDHSSKRALIEERSRETLERVTLAQCIEEFGWYARFESETQRCSRHRRTLSVMALDAACPEREASHDLEGAFSLGFAVSRRVFASLLVLGAGSRPTTLLMTPWSDGTLEPSAVDLPAGFWSDVAVHESWVLVFGSGRIAVFDAERPTAPPRLVDLPGERIRDIAFSSDNALVSLGEDGLVVLPLMP